MSITPVTTSWGELLLAPLQRAGPTLLAFTGVFFALHGLFAYAIVPRFAPKGLKAAQYGDLVRLKILAFDPLFLLSRVGCG